VLRFTQALERYRLHQPIAGFRFHGC
jgi:hypothetical protein